MKKKSFIAGALALSLVLAGTGYAYWTENLNVTTKAETGNVSVKFVDFGLYAKYSNEYTSDTKWAIVDNIDSGYVEAKEYLYDQNSGNMVATNQNEYTERAKGYNKINFTGSGLATNESLDNKSWTYPAGYAASHKINISLTGLYPGYAQVFRTDIANDGSLAVKLSNINFTVSNSNNAYYDRLNNMVGIALYSDTEFGKALVQLSKQFTDDQKFTVGGVDFVRLSALTDAIAQGKLQKALADNDNNIVKYGESPNGTVDLFIGLAMDPDAQGVYTNGSVAKLNEAGSTTASNYNSYTMLKDAQVTMDFQWDQFNVGQEDQVTTGNVLTNAN